VGRLDGDIGLVRLVPIKTLTEARAPLQEKRRGCLPQRVERPSSHNAGGAGPMMNQEIYVGLEDLRKQGWTIKEIAAETG